LRKILKSLGRGGKKKGCGENEFPPRPRFPKKFRGALIEKSHTIYFVEILTNFFFVFVFCTHTFGGR